VPFRSWSSAWGTATVMVTLAAAVAVVIGLLGWIAFHQDGPEPVSVPSTMPAAALPPISAEPPKTSDPDVMAPTTTATAQAAPPPPPTVTVQAEPASPSRDDEFLERLQADQLVIHNRAEALNGARWMCRQLAAGHSQAEVVASAERDNPTVTHLGMVDYVAASALFYCPEYSGS